MLLGCLSGDVVFPIIMNAAGLTSCEEIVNSDDLSILLLLVGTTNAYETFVSQEYFILLYLNNRKPEYPISLSKFLEILGEKPDYCLSLTVFQNCIYASTLKEPIWESILERRINIEYIREYKSEHNGKSPVESACKRFIRKSKKLPDPFNFDYELPEELEAQAQAYILTRFLDIFKPFYDVPKIPMDRAKAILKNKKALYGEGMTDTESVDSLGMNLVTSEFFDNDRTPDNFLPPPEVLPVTVIDHTDVCAILPEKLNINPTKVIEEKAVIPDGIKRLEVELPGFINEFE